MYYTELTWIEPEVLFSHFSSMVGSIFLDSSDLDNVEGRYSIVLINPIKIFSAEYGSTHYDFSLWDNLLSNNKNEDHTFPFMGGLVGFFSYDCVNNFENLVIKNIHKVVPDYKLGLYNQFFIFDGFSRKVFLCVVKLVDYNCNYYQQYCKLKAIYNNISKIAYSNNILPKLSFHSNFTQSDYINMVNQVKDYIIAGDVFEVNVAQQFTSDTDTTHPASIWNLYNKMRLLNPAHFSSFMNFDTIKILSLSPERWLNVSRSKIVVVPMKGTIRRDLYDKSKDFELTQQLLNSEKDCAENVMIVDLMRNDLAKICTANSIKVSKLCKLKSISHLHQLISVIEAEVKDNTSITTLLSAMFPAGSITGAPKIRAMEIIDELEDKKRGVYCGCIGYFSFNGDIDLAVSIRTMYLNDKKFYYSAGGAVTLLSDPLEEYLESISKAEFIFQL